MEVHMTLVRYVFPSILPYTCSATWAPINSLPHDTARALCSPQVFDLISEVTLIESNTLNKARFGCLPCAAIYLSHLSFKFICGPT